MKVYRYVAVVEDPDGHTWEQGYNEFEDLIEFVKSLGLGYRICEIYY